MRERVGEQRPPFAGPDMGLGQHEVADEEVLEVRRLEEVGRLPGEKDRKIRRDDERQLEREGQFGVNDDCGGMCAGDSRDDARRR